MLLNLSIQNIVLVDRLEVPFAPGLCVLTGETGAGKSILLDALGLTLGRRAEARLVRAGQNQGSAIAEFDIGQNAVLKAILEEQGLSVEDTLLLRRVVYADGKSKAYVNDAPVSASLLQTLAEQLVEIHGQHDQKGLMQVSTHKEVLDVYGQHQLLCVEVAKCYDAWQSAVKKHEEVCTKATKAKEEEEYLRHVLQELTELNPQPGEEEQLAEQRTIMMHAEKILETLKAALSELTDQRHVGDAIRSAERILDRSQTQVGERFVPALIALDRAGTEVQEAITVIESIANAIDMDANTLEQTEERLFALRAAARKHHRSVDELSSYQQEVAQQLALLESQEESLAGLEAKVKKTQAAYIDQAKKLTVQRKQTAATLQQAVEKELVPLKMNNSRFQAEIDSLPEEQWGASGQDKISFQISTNPGSPFGPLGKIASGGELSRFMLALKVVLSGNSSVPTLIFDEIDTGIGGAVADAVGQRLAQLAEQAQVLCVTHQPQVASYGTYHLRVEKQEQRSQVTTTVEALSEQARKEEVARMLAGATITEEARAAAGKLMEA